MNYNREFLVPYLQNICALELAERELDKKVVDLYSNEEKLKKGENNEVFHVSEKKESLWFGMLTFPIGLAAIVFFIWLIMEKGFLECIGIVIGIAILGCFFEPLWLILFPLVCVFFLPNTIWENRKIDEKYAKENERVEKAKEANERARREQLPAIQRDFVKYSIERENVRDLLKEAYDVNIIPSRYRDIYVAVYLYDYFSTSMSTDLEAALNLYVLEQIKDRLDRIIENQAEIILNQRVMIAKQQEAIVLQKEHNENLISKINKLIAGDEERNMYLNMIEFNTSATAYFAAADYFRSQKDTIV